MPAKFCSPERYFICLSWLPDFVVWLVMVDIWQMVWWFVRCMKTYPGLLHLAHGVDCLQAPKTGRVSQTEDQLDVAVSCDTTDGGKNMAPLIKDCPQSSLTKMELEWLLIFLHNWKWTLEWWTSSSIPRSLIDTLWVCFLLKF